MRGTAAAATSDRRTGAEPGGATVPPRRGASAARSSTSVLHAPHSGQRPSHCGLWAPQAVHEKTVAGRLAIVPSWSPMPDSLESWVLAGPRRMMLH